MVVKRFGRAMAKAIDQTKYFYLRAGEKHRFIGVWVVVVDGRAFVRPWNDAPTGWYRAFLENPEGEIKVGGRVVPVRARKVRGVKLLDAMDVAFASKYTTKANRQYVEGLATEERRARTLELVPG